MVRSWFRVVVFYLRNARMLGISGVFHVAEEYMGVFSGSGIVDSGRLPAGRYFRERG